MEGIDFFAGVHLWTGSEDVAYIGNGWLTVHVSRDGHRAIRFPEPSAVYDLSEGRLVAHDSREHRFFAKAGATRTFCVGSIEHFNELGLPNLDLKQSNEPRAVLSQTVDAEPEGEPGPPAAGAPSTMTEDMQTLQAVLTMDLSQIEGLPLDEMDSERTPTVVTPAADPAEAEARLAALLPDGELLPAGRRRRRRGGRGRGRRRPDQAGELEGTDGDAVSRADVTPAGNGLGDIQSNSGSGASTADRELSGGDEPSFARTSYSGNSDEEPS